MRTGKYDVGTLHETNNSGTLEIVGKEGGHRRRVRFLKTGFVTTASNASIRNGNVRDPYSPVVFGVGYMGVFIEHPLRKVLELRWRKMLERVYSIKNGKTVDSSWLCFADFQRDALELPGIELLYTHSKANRIDLDSDILAKEKGLPSMYSKETCQWVTKATNNLAREMPKRFNVRPIGTVIETRHGAVTLISKNKQRWLIRFNDGVEKWFWSVSVLNDTFAKPE